MGLQSLATTTVFQEEQRRPAASICEITPAALHARAGVLRGRRRITRESGRALERIGHAVDYLFDTYVHQGQGSVVLHGQSPEIQAIRILVHARERVLRALPEMEPISKRIWNFFGGRKAVPMALK